MEPFVGQLMLFAGNFVPVGYLPCDGSLQPISEYQVLYMLLGTTYGGDGMNTFGLPDLRGRAPQHFGNGLGLQPVVLGQLNGSENNTITAGQMPGHNHTFTATVTPSCNSTDAENADTPVNDYPRRYTGVNTYSTTQNGQTGQSAPFNIPMSASGSSLPIENLQPSMAMTFCISSVGIYPSQP